MGQTKHYDKASEGASTRFGLSVEARPRAGSRCNGARGGGTSPHCTAPLEALRSMKRIHPLTAVSERGNPCAEGEERCADALSLMRLLVGPLSSVRSTPDGISPRHLHSLKSASPSPRLAGRLRLLAASYSHRTVCAPRRRSVATGLQHVSMRAPLSIQSLRHQRARLYACARALAAGSGCARAGRSVSASVARARGRGGGGHGPVPRAPAGDQARAPLR
jgi:hypothetical protein